MNEKSFKVVYVDEERHWWIGEPLNPDPVIADIRIIGECDEDFKAAFPAELIESINYLAPQIVWFDDEGNLSGSPVSRRKIIFQK